MEEKEGTDIPFNFDIASTLVFDEKKWSDQVSVTTLFINPDIYNYIFRFSEVHMCICAHMIATPLHDDDSILCSLSNNHNLKNSGGPTSLAPLIGDKKWRI